MATHSFTRQELYDLVWSMPMQTLALGFGISGTGLAKVCNKFDVPVPERGYWNKLRAGHAVVKAPLPPPKSSFQSRVTINPLGPRQQEPQVASVTDGVKDVMERLGAVEVPKSIKTHHPIVDLWISERKKDRQNYSLSSSREPIDGSELSDRRLRICTTMFGALERLGFKLKPGESRFWGVQLFQGTIVFEMEVEERIAQKRERLTVAEKAKRRAMHFPYQEWKQIKVPTGELRVKAKGRYSVAKEWRETSESPIQARLPEIISQIAGLFEEVRVTEQRQLEDEQRRREAHLERELRAFEQERERVRVRRLVRQCDNWKVAEDIREFVAVATARPESGGRSDLEAWKAWQWLRPMTSILCTMRIYFL